MAWVRLVRRVQLPRTAIAGAVLAVIGLACVVEFWRSLRVETLGLLLGIGTAVASLEVVATVLIASPLLGETLGALQLAWGGIVLAGAFLPQQAMTGHRGRPATYFLRRTPRGDVPAGKCLRTYDDSHTVGRKH